MRKDGRLNHHVALAGSVYKKTYLDSTPVAHSGLFGVKNIRCLNKQGMASSIYTPHPTRILVKSNTPLSYDPNVPTSKKTSLSSFLLSFFDPVNSALTTSLRILSNNVIFHIFFAH